MTPLEVLNDSGDRSPIFVNDLDLYPQPPNNTRSPALNSKDLVNVAGIVMDKCCRRIQ